MQWLVKLCGERSMWQWNGTRMTPNYRVIVESYPNRTEWLTVQFPTLKLSLYLTDTSHEVKRLMCSPKKKRKHNKYNKWKNRPLVSWRWTNWVWEIIGSHSRLQQNYRSFQRNIENIPQTNKKNPERSQHVTYALGTWLSYEHLKACQVICNRFLDNNLLLQILTSVLTRSSSSTHLWKAIKIVLLFVVVLLNFELYGQSYDHWRLVEFYN